MLFTVFDFEGILTQQTLFIKSGVSNLRETKLCTAVMTTFCKLPFAKFYTPIAPTTIGFEILFVIFYKHF